jgi:hypothetical protein
MCVFEFPSLTFSMRFPQFHFLHIYSDEMMLWLLLQGYHLTSAVHTVKLPVPLLSHVLVKIIGFRGNISLGPLLQL